MSMVAVARARPRAFPVGCVADRGAALELRRAVRDILGVEGQVVRAGLGGQIDTGRPGPLASCGRTSAHETCKIWTRPPVPAGRIDAPGRPRGFSAARGRERRNAVIAGAVRRRGLRRSPCASSACTISSAAEPGGLGHRVRESGSGPAAGTRRRPSATRKHLKPKTPASCSGRRSREVVGDRAAPEADVDVRLPASALSASASSAARSSSEGCCSAACRRSS